MRLLVCHAPNKLNHLFFWRNHRPPFCISKCWQFLCTGSPCPSFHLEMKLHLVLAGHILGYCSLLVLLHSSQISSRERNIAPKAEISSSSSKRKVESIRFSFGNFTTAIMLISSAISNSRRTGTGPNGMIHSNRLVRRFGIYFTIQLELW